MNQSHQPHQDAKGSYIAQADRGGVAQVITNIFQGGSNEARELRNRQNMLQLVWNTWIEGVLKKSLYNEMRIELGLETRPEAIEHPWDMVIQMPDQEPRQIASGTTMLELFDNASGAILILGEPGSGKTTILLELTSQLILRAQQDTTQSIPVIFNLSTWTPKQTISEWLISELRQKYYVTQTVGRTWIENDELLLLLDGLDEVRDENREKCASAINQFRDEHNVHLAICSRRQEYEALETRLMLSGAVLIKPLTKPQVDKYLQGAGVGLDAIRQVLHRDPELQEFAQTPLILSIMVLTYREASGVSLTALKTADDYHKHLFDDYIGQMFGRRGLHRQYIPERIIASLAWLGGEMLKRNQTIFYVEYIQADWAPFSIKKIRPFLGLGVGLSVLLIFGLMGIACSISTIIPEVITLVRSREWIFDIIDVIYVLIFWLILGLFLGLFLGLIFGLFSKSIIYEPIEKLSFRGKKATIGLIAGLITFVIVGLVTALIFGLGDGLGAGLIAGLIIGLKVGLSGGLIGAPMEHRRKPGAGIKKSLRSALIVGLIAALIIGLIAGLIGGLTVFLTDSPIVIFTLIYEIDGVNPETGELTPYQPGDFSRGLTFGYLFFVIVFLIVMPIAGLLYGGRFLITHFIVRFFLYRAGNIPWRLVTFLDHCTDLIFMRRVGGGYIFIHRMLMEHFAAMADGGTGDKALMV